MNPEEPKPPPFSEQMNTPFALVYGTQGPARPALITTMGVIGICVASLALMVAAFGTLSAVVGIFVGRSSPTMQWQTQGAAAVTMSEAVVGALLGIALLIGCIGLLRLRSWSRRLLLWRGVLYLVNDCVFLALQLTIVVPSQTNMVTTMFKSMPAPMFTTAPTTTAGSGVTTAPAVTYTATAGSSGSPTFSFGPGTPPNAQMVSMMKLTYTIMAIGKTVICLVFPVVLLIVMQLKSLKAALHDAARV